MMECLIRTPPSLAFILASQFVPPTPIQHAHTHNHRCFGLSCVDRLVPGRQHIRIAHSGAASLFHVDVRTDLTNNAHAAIHQTTQTCPYLRLQGVLDWLWRRPRRRAMAAGACQAPYSGDTRQLTSFVCCAVLCGPRRPFLETPDHTCRTDDARYRCYLMRLVAVGA